MVEKLTNVMSLTGQGLRDWLIQRMTALVLAAYVIFLMGFILTHSPLQFFDWQALFLNTGMRVFSVLALLSLICHSWVGVWTIATDYIKITWARVTFMALVIIALLAFLVWGIDILWSVNS